MAHKQFSAQNVSCVEVEKLVYLNSSLYKREKWTIKKKKKKGKMVGFSNMNAPEFDFVSNLPFKVEIFSLI